MAVEAAREQLVNETAKVKKHTTALAAALARRGVGPTEEWLERVNGGGGLSLSDAIALGILDGVLEDEWR